ncbi:MAG TPA: LCP family protein [Mycobacteriales bacterium]|nr:LCP family protein [Mycobacteriales bacterium]
MSESGSRDPRGRYDQRGRLPPELDPRRRARADRPPPGPPSRGGRGGPPGPGRRRRIGVVLKLLATVLSAVVLVASGLLWAGYHKYNAQIDRIDAIPAQGNHATVDVDGEDMNILLVGNDSRDSATNAQLSRLGTERDGGSSNTDTMILVHIPADGRKATVVSFPRDLWVDIPGIGPHKLNAAYPNGSRGGTSKQARAAGARLLIQTLSNLTGLRIDHYVEVDLLGFYDITEAIGGVEVNLCKPAKDHFSGIDLPAGPQIIKGTQALAFVRQRHGLPNGDLDRIHRQQYFLGAVVRKMTSAGVLLNPVKLNKVLDAITASLHADPGFDPLRLAQQMRELAAGNVAFLTAPNKGPADVDGQSVVLPDTTAMGPFFANLSDDQSNRAQSQRAVPPGQVHVRVLNGAGQSRLARRTADGLDSAGFAVSGFGNASSRQQSTTIRYSADQQAAAQTLAAAVPGAALERDDSLGDTVQLVLGSDFGGLHTGSTGGSAGSGSSDGSGGSAGSGGSDPAPRASSTPDRTAADTGCIN